MWLIESRKKKVRGKSRRSSRPFFLNMNSGARGRGAGRRVLKRLLAVAALAAALLLLGLGTRAVARSLFHGNDLFRIRYYDIRCDGRHIGRDYIMNYASLNSYSNLFAINIAALRGYLLDRLPRVEDVEISRLLDGSVRIEVRERIPVARLAAAGAFMEIDGKGHVLGPPPKNGDEGSNSGSTTAVRTLPMITGHNVIGLKPGIFLGETAVMNAIEVLDACESTPIGQVLAVSSIDVQDREFLKLRLADGALVKLAWSSMSDHSDISRGFLMTKLELLAETIRKAAERRERIVEIDMTVERDFPARFRRQ